VTPQDDDDFITFEKALRDLKLQSEELKKLVSEGEIRAFRDGESMKFRREDVEALATDDDPLVFADTLEDDTGMVTAELSEEDTLLAEDDFLEDEDESIPVPRATASRARAKAVVDEGDEREPVWVTATAILGAVVMLYGFMVIYSVAMESSPGSLIFWQ
jgi:excisionase family DNA binding protein